MDRRFLFGDRKTKKNRENYYLTMDVLLFISIRESFDGNGVHPHDELSWL